MAESETRTVTYFAPGTVPDLTPVDALLDPKLAEIRDAEVKANDVTIESALEPTIDPELVKVRDAEIKRLGGQPIAADSEQAPAKASARKSSK